MFMIDWLILNYIQVLGVVSGLLFLYFEYKENVLLWPLGLVTSMLYIIVFYQSKFYADMSLQVYYVVISAYGWFVWMKGRDKMQKVVHIKYAGNALIIRIVGISFVLWYVLYEILIRYTDSPVPLGDAFTSAFSITATWMLSRKLLEQWWFWVIINFISVGLYVYRELYPTAFLFVVYGIISVAGYYEWKRKLTINEIHTTHED